mmetsp:Transcript_40327/g.131789  ORF Transcript_40327/g.131789 Transcript_40327/m.131789 type:complete len:200 (+) Transcript_40327:237-836(+)
MQERHCHADREQHRHAERRCQRQRRRQCDDVALGQGIGRRGGRTAFRAQEENEAEAAARPGGDIERWHRGRRGVRLLRRRAGAQAFPCVCQGEEEARTTRARSRGRRGVGGRVQAHRRLRQGVPAPRVVPGGRLRGGGVRGGEHPRRARRGEARRDAVPRQVEGLAGRGRDVGGPGVSERCAGGGAGVVGQGTGRRVGG